MRVGIGCLIGLVAWGCGERQPAKDPTASDTAATVEGAEAPSPGRAEPASLQGVFVITNVERLWASLAKLAPEFEGKQEMAALGPNKLAEIFLGPELVAFVPFGETTVFALVTEDDMVGSLPIVRFDEAVAALGDSYRLRARGGEVWELSGKELPGQLFASGGACQLHRTSAEAGRLVCAGNDGLLRANAGFVASYPLEVERREPGGDVPLRMDVPRRVWTESFRDIAKVADGADPSEQLGHDMALEVMRAIESAYFDADPTQDPVRVGVGLRFGKTRPFLTSGLIGPDGGPMPDAFFDLPADSLVAVAFTGGSIAERRAEARALFDSFVDSISKEDFDQAGRAEIVQVMSELFLTGGPSLFAYGADLDTQVKALASVRGQAKVDPAALAVARDALSGWMLFGAPEPLERWKKGLRNFIALDQRYSRVRVASGGGPAAPASSLKAVPFGATVTAAPATKSASFVRELPLDAKWRLPSDSLHLETRSLPNTAYVAKAGELPTTPSVTHVVLAPGGDHTFLCVSSSLETCAQRLAVVRAKAPRATLRGNALRAELTSARGPIRGLLSPAGLISLFTFADTKDEIDESSSLSDLERMPGSRSPFVLESTWAEAKGTLRLGVRVPASALATWLPALAED